MPYIHFTEQEKQQANQTDITAYLTAHGETVKKCGSESSWESPNGKVSIRGSSWYSQYERVGGGAVGFLQKFYGLSYPEAVRALLGQRAETGMTQRPEPAPAASGSVAPPKDEKSFPMVLPPRHSNMRRLFAYLTGERCIDRDVLHAFTHAGLIYEDAEFHNAVFIGTDENGKPMHAQKRSTRSGSGYKGNVAGSQADYSFHFIGQSEKLFVFEAPIDLLAYISLHKEGWEQHSYVALCSTANCAALWMLKTYPYLKSIYLCLDHDSAGIEGAYRIAENIRLQGEYSVWRKMPRYKDWDEVLKALHGHTPIPSSEHQRLDHFKALCDRLQSLEIDDAAFDLDLHSCRGYLAEQTFGTIKCLLEKAEHAADIGQVQGYLFEIAQAVLVYCSGRDRQMAVSGGTDGYIDCIRSDYKPHRDHSRAKDILTELKNYCSALEKEIRRKDVVTIREAADRNLWMCRIASLAFQMSGALEWEQTQKQHQNQTQLDTTVSEPAMNFA